MKNKIEKIVDAVEAKAEEVVAKVETELTDVEKLTKEIVEKTVSNPSLLSTIVDLTRKFARDHDPFNHNARTTVVAELAGHALQDSSHVVVLGGEDRSHNKELAAKIFENKLTEVTPVEDK